MRVALADGTVPCRVACASLSEAPARIAAMSMASWNLADSMRLSSRRPCLTVTCEGKSRHQVMMRFAMSL